MTDEQIIKEKAHIDTLTQIDMARLWRFASPGHPYFTAPLFEYFRSRFVELGGFTPEISKEIGFN